jgi:hypothetical protein
MILRQMAGGGGAPSSLLKWAKNQIEKSAEQTRRKEEDEGQEILCIVEDIHNLLWWSSY